jgi:hypothetical protein
LTVGGKEFQVPDFIVEELDCYLRAGSPAIDAAAADADANDASMGHGFIETLYGEREGCCDLPGRVRPPWLTA